ncbi:Zinc finger CCCH domain-containing protein 3 [Phytophthora pseudosyringae]|uniref:Zinc finger CCCH domain-containing protein 3 n=1 Tax=Phytophthora pseudosyringae TaxID=221518 RepID=A0A8T1WKZ0_9STRA|nr:Zinc finger CCCH domain-containing protein 3 [Phytophthora pseudosyringae]
MEEATLRAKIQAMKNLLEAKRQSAAPAASSHAYSRLSHGPYQSRTFAASGPVNRSWNRFSPPAAAANRSHAGAGSANKVWRREDTPATTTSPPVQGAVKGAMPPNESVKAWKRPVKVATNKSKSLQLQVLRLEDGEYSKANGGFSLVRAGVKKPTTVTSASRAVATAKPMPVTRTNSSTLDSSSDSVHIGGVKYVVANGGKVLKRCSTEERKTSGFHRPGSMSLTTMSGAARAALVRAKATMQRARSKRFQTKKVAKRRTVYCSFYNRFGKYPAVVARIGYCKNKNECRFIHDSRRVAMCRKFLKNECTDPKCLLSHQHDENKVPDCKMFLRGACTREGCKYRHVKVTATAELCVPFTKGYCPMGGSCPFRHELPRPTRKSPMPAASGQNTSSKPTTASERRQQAPDVLRELSVPVLLLDGDDADGRSQSDDDAAGDLGIRMEQLSLRAQREIWSALASGASPSEDAAAGLARAFFRVAGRERRRATDAVCVSLARMVLRGEEEGEQSEVLQETTTDAAFRRRMRRLTLSRVKFPSPEDEDADTGQHSQSGGNKVARTAEAAYSLLSKRSRANVSEEQPPMEVTEESSRNKTRASTETGGKTPERPPLTKEMEDRASGLAKQLGQLPRAQATAAVDDVATRAFDMLAEVVNDAHTTYAANEQSFQCLCKVLRMDSTSDEALSQITSALVDSNWSSRYAAIFLETSVLAKIRAADSVISRVLLQTALRFGSSYAGTLVDSLLLPLLVGAENEDPNHAFGPPQAEAITRILRSPDTVPVDQLDGFIQKSLEGVTANESVNSRPHLLSNESALLVFQNILNTKPKLSPLTVETIVAACDAVLERPEVEHARGSLKFATVIFTLISKYPLQCAGHVETLEAIANQLTSIMAKTTLRSLQKLRTSK